MAGEPLAVVVEALIQLGQATDAFGESPMMVTRARTPGGILCKPKPRQG